MPPAPSDPWPNNTTLAEVLDLLACPVCLHALAATAAAVICAGCGRSYPVIDGIPVLLADRATNRP